jgi:transposase
MKYVGIDFHYRVSMICILNAQGRQIKSHTIRGDWHKVLDYLKHLEPPFSVCYEASTGYGWLFDHLKSMASCVQVAHPGHLRLIFRSKRKTDRIDAEKLAKLLFLGEIPPVYVPSSEVRDWRSMIEYREGLLRTRTGLKNRIRALLRGHVIRPPKGLWSQKGLSWLEELRFSSAAPTVQRNMLLESLSSQNLMLREVETYLNQRARQHPGVKLLMTIPGVGIRTAEAVIAYH